MDRVRSTDRWLIALGLAFVVALGLALLVLSLYRPSQPPREREDVGAGLSVTTDLPSSLAEGPTARQAYPPAMDVARSWQADGHLAVVSAHWRPRQGRWPTEVTWMFQFYSPAARRLAVVVVEGGRARLLREALSPYPLPSFSEADWQVDSLAALDAWWSAGGATFLSIHSEVDLMAQLRPLEGGGGQPMWTVTGIAGDQVKNLVVDGMTGEQVQN